MPKSKNIEIEENTQSSEKGNHVHGKNMIVSLLLVSLLANIGSLYYLAI